MELSATGLSWTVGANREASPPSAPQRALSFLKENKEFLSRQDEEPKKLADCFAATLLTDELQSEQDKQILALLLTQSLEPTNAFKRLEWALEHKNIALAIATILFLHEIVKKPGVNVGYKALDSHSTSYKIYDVLLALYAYNVQAFEKASFSYLKLTPKGRWSKSINDNIGILNQYVPVFLCITGYIQGTVDIAALPKSLYGLSINTSDEPKVPPDNSFKRFKCVLQSNITALTLPEATFCSLRWMDNITTLIAPKLETLILEDCPKLNDLQIPKSCTVTYETSPDP
ncbi:MAG: hypothetical protein KDK62_03470 [Chlamydiia bacterium]|nr:hypothetical protein [Chlamydiia bacterium]